MVQYNAVLIIAGAIKGTARGKLYQELGLESLADGRWKIIKIILGTEERIQRDLQFKQKKLKPSP